MRGTTLQRAYPIVAAALGRKFGVEVVIHGNLPRTNGKVIVLPVLPDDPKVTDVAWGYLAHEAAHVRYTDFSADRHENSEVRLSLQNRIEDVRIERNLGQEYPGTIRTLEQAILWIAHERPYVPDRNKPTELLLMHVTHKLRYEVLGQQFQALAEQTDQAMREAFPKGVITRLHALLADVPALQSTSEVIHLAERILAMLKEEQEREQERKKQKGENSASKGKDQTQRGRGKGKSPPSDPSESDTDNDATSSEASERGEQGSTSGKDDADSEPPEDGRQDTPSASSEENDPASDEAIQNIASVLGAGAGDVPKDVFAEIAERLGVEANKEMRRAGVAAVMPQEEMAGSNAALNQQVLSRVRADSNRLRSQLTGLVQSEAQERDYRKDRGRRLDTKALHRLRLNDFRVFRHRDETQAPNTAFHLLVDASGSMSDMVEDGSCRCIDLALDSAVAVSIGLSTIAGVNAAVTAFPGHGRNTVQVLQRHGERIRQVAGRFVQNPRGSTPLYQALWYATSRLLAQPEPRKVLLVLTDGAPDDPGAVADLMPRLERGGIECYGIGIGTMAVENLFRKHHVINKTSELREALFTIARAALRAA